MQSAPCSQFRSVSSTTTFCLLSELTSPHHVKNRLESSPRGDISSLKDYYIPRFQAVVSVAYVYIIHLHTPSKLYAYRVEKSLDKFWGGVWYYYSDGYTMKKINATVLSISLETMTEHAKAWLIFTRAAHSMSNTRNPCTSPRWRVESATYLTTVQTLSRDFSFFYRRGNDIR